MDENTKAVLEQNARMLEDHVDNCTTTASIHTIAFVAFLFLGIAINSLWALLWLALSIYNGFKAVSAWNAVSQAKQMKAQDNEFQGEMKALHNYWYDENGEMREERIEEARQRLLEKEEQEKQ